VVVDGAVAEDGAVHSAAAAGHLRQGLAAPDVAVRSEKRVVKVEVQLERGGVGCHAVHFF
jgi:hypothetical protein